MWLTVSTGIKVFGLQQPGGVLQTYQIERFYLQSDNNTIMSKSILLLKPIC